MGQPLYRQVADGLREAIGRGDYLPGSLIPKEQELADRFGVSRSVVRQAVAELRMEGLVDPVRKRGTVVRERPIRLALSRYAATLRPDSAAGPWETACAAQDLEGRTEVDHVTVQRADDELAGRIGIDVGAEVVYRRRHMWIGDQLTQIQHSWLPLDLVAGTPIASPEKVDGGIYAALAAAGHEPASITESVTARVLADDEVAAMKVPKTTPALILERLTLDEARAPLEFLRSVILAERAVLLYEDLPIGGS